MLLSTLRIWSKWLLIGHICALTQSAATCVISMSKSSARDEVSSEKRVRKRSKTDDTETPPRPTQFSDETLAITTLNSAPWNPDIINPFDPKPVIKMQESGVYVDSCPFEPETQRSLFTVKARRRGEVIMDIGNTSLTTEQVIQLVLPVAHRKRRSDKTKNKLPPRLFYEFLCADFTTEDYLDNPANAGMPWVDLVACESPTIFMQSASKARNSKSNCFFVTKDKPNKDGSYKMQLIANRKIKAFSELLGDYVDASSPEEEKRGNEQ